MNYYCNKWTMYLLIWVGKSVMHRRDKSSNADNSNDCTYKYMQLRHWFPFCHKLAEFMNFQWISSMANSVMHWRICTFLDASAALLYTVHWNQANTLILVEILVIVKCLVNVKYCSDFYTDEEFILCVRDADCCWVSKVSCVGLLENRFQLTYAGWAISANNYLGKLFGNLF